MLKRLFLFILPGVLFNSVCLGANEFNVDCFFGWDGYCRPSNWTAVNVGIASTLTEPFEGVLSISAQQDGLNNMIVNHEFVLTPGIRLNIPLITKFAFAAQNCSVRITTPGGKTVWAKKYDLWDYSEDKQKLHFLSENDLLIGFVGRREGSFGIMKLADEASCKYGDSIGKVYVKDKLPSQLPWDWTGYGGVDILVLYDADLGQCNKSQLNAIEQWVRNGGKLLMVLSSKPLSEGNPLRSALPFEILQSGQYRIPNDTAEKLRLSEASNSQVIAWPIKTNDSELCDFVTIDDELAVFATGYSGFGRVGVLSFNPSTSAGITTNDPMKFWVNLISSILVDPSMPKQDQQLPNKNEEDRYNYNQIRFELNKIHATSMRDIIEGVKIDENNNSYYSNTYGIGLEQAGSNTVMEYLLNIPQMRPLSIWWVILLLVLLAVLLGPVDYIVLKKLDRQPLTWLTCTFWIVLFTVGAYYGVQALRSGELQYRSVCVTDSIASDGSTFSTTHAGIFAPKSDKYNFDGIKDGQWWSAISMEQRDMYFYNRQNATRNVYCMQYDGTNLPYSMPINIWTMQCLLCEEPEDDFPMRANISISDGNVALEITNRSNANFEKGYVFVKDSKVFEFGPVDKLSTKKFDGSLKNRKIWESNNKNNYDAMIRYINPILNNEEAYIAKGSLDRTKALRAMLERGAAVICVETNTQEPAIRVKDKQCQYTNRNLYRLLVFPQ